ncbi:up-regulator of cell proliferation-like [Malaclemys terrapin pileata]|uniref:up-regulator of cell proliferation-like n=1 Tax=Malaclemys terrapin pileata TaxID=2991368 RepID=UPI0023A7E87C|nr:up-regulator of cell proliferation-like [Malaclemys terrapin pileata]
MGGRDEETSTEPVQDLEEKEENLELEAERKSVKKFKGWVERRAFQNILSKLNLEQHKSKKLRLRDVLEIRLESLKNWTPQTLGDLPWHFLRKVMALNGTARNTSLVQMASDDQGTNEDEENMDIDDIFTVLNTDTSDSLHPLDVLCAILGCSDSFLQQQILSKMSMCQFALPLLLPALDTPKCTLMLWAMRDIVKKWRPRSLAQSRGFREESLVLTKMPTISFVRMGSCSFSKSKLLNELLSSSQQHQDFFVHRDMESGNIPQEIASGLVEISWYFPRGRENSDIFPEAIAVTNLRGDIESHSLQFRFLTEISTAVFIVTDRVSEREYKLLSSLKESTTKYYFILKAQAGKHSETLEFLNKLAPVLKLNRSQLLVKDSTSNKTAFLKTLQSTIGSIMNSSPKTVSIEDMVVTAQELKIQIDEECEECQNARKCSKEITKEVKDLPTYRSEMLKLQGDLWKKLAKVEKELCRMKRQLNTPTEKYKSQLREERLELRRQQNQFNLTHSLSKFLHGIGQILPVERHYFLNWLKFDLDCISRENLSKLWAEYKSKCEPLGDNFKEDASTLGVEHFIRELGQFYEAECSMFKEGDKAECQRQFIHLPGIAADLMLEGFPMELIDGDASNIPLQWVTDVLTQLHAKLGGRSRMVVLSVLGVQSTGKSTLLNTMFGLQFAVSSGRCTRGAFMTLIKVAENFQQELGCDFFLVIDAEGLKAPELAKLEDSYEHDNELATLVIGLSDITIVNMAMENATEMKDVLQIVVHAFLRMEEIGQKRNCQFVHQNVSDVSAYKQNMRDRKHLLEQLNEMTKAAAKMEKLSREMTFSDIMEYQPEKHNWYIPGLWHGVPPMAPVNIGYSESVCELKKYLYELMKYSDNRAPKDIPQFIEWVKSLWNAVKHENFIFSFRNSLIAEAYNRLSAKYAEWEWGFRKEMHLWVLEKETLIHNHTPDELHVGNLKDEMQQKLLYGEQQILNNLQQYFESRAANLHLIEKYAEDFTRSAKSLKEELERYSMCKCEETIHIKEGQHKIDNILTEYMKLIEGKVDRILEDHRKRECELDNKELQAEFEKMWKKSLRELNPFSLPKCDIYQDVEFQLRRDLGNRGSAVNKKLQEAGNLLNYKMNSFRMKKEYIDTRGLKTRRKGLTQELCYKAEELVKSLMDQCRSYCEKTVNSKLGYDQTYCRELLYMINERLQQEDVSKLHTSGLFEVDLKLHILGEVAHAFQKMHEDFVNENDPQKRLQKQKPHYLSRFRDLYLHKEDACQRRAKDFCDQCLRPALLDYVNKRLGIEIVEDFLRREQSTEYSSRSSFQFTMQKKLLEEMNFSNYVKYIKSYEVFVKTWVWRCLVDHYRQTDSLEDLEREILSTIIKKVMDALENSRIKKIDSVSAFLDNFCQLLQTDLIISKENLIGIRFINTENTDEFSAFIRSFLPNLEEEILVQFKGLEMETQLSQLPLKPQDEIYKRMFGCGKQCPFCKVPCEAGGTDHKEHFATVHRPKGLWQDGSNNTQRLEHSSCSEDVISNEKFRNSDTQWKPHPYKDYRCYYPDWCIQPDPSLTASNYWKFVFKEFNEQFAKEYDVEPADLPRDWGKITKKQALESLEEVFSMK